MRADNGLKRLRAQTSLLLIILRLRIIRWREGPGALHADECLTVGQHDLLEASDRVAVLGAQDRNGDLVTWLEGVVGPSALDHVGWIANFNGPMCDGSGFILGVELQETMGIRPGPRGYGTLNGYRGGRFERRRSMMREQRARQSQKSHGEGDKEQRLSGHESPPVSSQINTP